MRKLYFIILFSALSVGLFSQAGAPQFINYQAIARDAAGNVITVGSIGIKFEILKSGSPVYVETQTAIPSSAGIFTAAIGSGTAPTGTFSLINWGNGPYDLRVNIDPAGGNSYSAVGTSSLLSVPFALYAENTKPSTLSIAGNSLSISNGNTVALPTGTSYTNGVGIAIAGTTITNTAPNQTVTIGNGINTTVNGTYPNYTIDATPTLTVVGAQMSISGGNTVTLPTGTTYTNGPGISLVSGTVITNTAQDKTVTITPGNTNITVNGVYPNFTVSSTPTLTFGAGVLSISNGNSIAIPTPPPATITGVGATTVTNVGQNFTVTTPIPTFTQSGITSITGPFPNFIVSTPNQTLTSNNFTLSSSYGGSAQLPSYAAGAGILTSGSYPTFTLSANSTGTSAVWSTLGNTGTNAPLNFLGTTDPIDLVFKTAGTERARILGSGANAGFIGINTALPGARLHVADLSSKILVDATGGGASVSEIDFKTVGAGTASIYKFNTGRLAMASGGAYNMQFLNSIGGSFQFDEGVNTRLFIAPGGSVSIGNTAPSSQLSVVGDIDIPGSSDYKYTSPKTKYYSIPSVDFSSENPAQYVNNGIGSHLYCIASTGTLIAGVGLATYFDAPVNLPDGATITQMDAYVVDNDPTYNISVVQLWRADSPTVSPFGTSTIIGSAGPTGGANPNVQVLTDNSIATPVVDNLNYSYYVRFGGSYCGPGAAAQNIRLARFLITYTVSKTD